MNLVNVVLLLIGLVCFLAATANVPARLNLIGAGLAAWVLVHLIVALRALG